MRNLLLLTEIIPALQITAAPALIGPLVGRIQGLIEDTACFPVVSVGQCSVYTGATL